MADLDFKSFDTHYAGGWATQDYAVILTCSSEIDADPGDSFVNTDAMIKYMEDHDKVIEEVMDIVLEEHAEGRALECLEGIVYESISEGSFIIN